MNIEKLRALYPTFSDEELVIAGENLDRYLLLAWEIYEDLKMRSEESPLTTADADHTMNGKVDSPQT